MARPQVREVSAPSAIQGVATPVPTYVRPADPGRSPLHDLAEGLAAFDAGLGKYLNKRKAETEESDKARALVDFNRNNQLGWAEAVRTGVVPASASPIYMESYKRAQGNLAGLKLQEKFHLDYQQWDGRNDADGEAYSQFVSQWMVENVGDEQDPHVLAGLAPHLERLSLGGLETFMSEGDARLKAGARATSGATLTHHLQESIDEGNATGSIDYETFWQRVLEERQEAEARGDLLTDWDSLLVDSILLQAERSNSKDVLKLLERKLPGQEYPMSYNQDVREKLTKTMNRIDAAQGAISSELARQREEAEKQQDRDLWAETLVRIAAGEEVPEETIVRLSRRDGTARAKVEQYKKDFAGFATQEDPQALLEIYLEIDRGADVGFVTEMYKKGVIRDPATLTKALDRVKAVKAATADGGIFTTPTYKDINKIITNETGNGMFSALDGTRGLSEEGAEALFDYRQMLLDWETKNPDASYAEKERAAYEMGQRIKERFQPNAEDPERMDYISERDQAELERQAAEEEAAAATETPEEEEGQSWYNYLTDWIWPGNNEEAPTEGEGSEAPSTPVPPLESLSEARRAAVSNLAQQRGISEEEANQLLHEEIEKIMNEQQPVDPTTTGSISEESRTKLAALLQDPPKVERLTASNVPVAPLLSLIGQTEGTDRGAGYNETLGYGAYTNGPVNLTGMTLDEIDELQTQMLRHPQNKWNSSAVGRYQIVRTTLRGLRDKLGLTGQERYTPELQDRLAMALLEGRGLSRWQAGQMSDEQFMANLSAEWASLPKANGKGTYRGQRVGTSAAGLRSALDRVRGTQVASLDPSSGFDDPALTAYSKIPPRDSRGEDQVAKFMEWNPDPVGNHEKNLSEVEPQLADVVRRAQELSSVKFVVGSGKRDTELQKKAKEWGWSKTEDSDHLHGSAVDLWPIDEDGAVRFDKKMQTQIVKAMKQAAKELGVQLDIGADWKSFKDLPHFGLKKKG